MISEKQWNELLKVEDRTIDENLNNFINLLVYMHRYVIDLLCNVDFNEDDPEERRILVRILNFKGGLEEMGKLLDKDKEQLLIEKIDNRDLLFVEALKERLNDD